MSMKVFAAVVESGSFGGSADRLGLSRAMISKHVAHLEEHLGTRLLQRTTRKLTLTESGAAYYDRCVQILTYLSEAEEAAVRNTEVPRGTLRITMPVSFGILHMAPIVSDYMKHYPEVKVDILLNDRKVDLLEEGLDLAVRIGSLSESGLIARKLASDRLAISAAPEYFENHGIPKTPADLAQHNCLIYSYSASGDEWRMAGPNGTEVVKVSGTLRATNGDLIKLAALSGAGIMRQPLFLCADELRSGRLVEVLSAYRSDEVGIYVLYPSRKHLSAKVRTFVDFMANAFARKREW